MHACISVDLSYIRVVCCGLPTGCSDSVSLDGVLGLVVLGQRYGLAQGMDSGGRYGQGTA